MGKYINLYKRVFVHKNGQGEGICHDFIELARFSEKKERCFVTNYVKGLNIQRCSSLLRTCEEIKEKSKEMTAMEIPT